MPLINASCDSTFIHLHMKHTVNYVSALLVGALASLCACSKEATTEAPQPSEKEKSYDFSAMQPLEARKAWGDFVQDVRKGIVQDPFGQYVSDETYVLSDAAGKRPWRNKVEPEARGIKNQTNTAAKFDQPSDPPTPCDGSNPCPPGGSTPPCSYIC